MSVKGTMTINDDEDWPANDEHRVRDFSQTVALTHQKPKGWVKFAYCVGREVAGYFFVEATLGSDDLVTWRPYLDLHEGASCTSQDIDGTHRSQASHPPAELLRGQPVGPDLQSGREHARRLGPRRLCGSPRQPLEDR